MLKKIFLLTTLLSGMLFTLPAQDAKMKIFVDALLKKMTLEEKIGQLNLITPGDGILTGSVVSTGVEQKIKSGNVGGMFGVIGVNKIRKAQELAVNNSRLKIPMLFGSDVIHGYKTTFPIPLALACSWDTVMVERSARVAANEATADGLNWAFSPMVDIARDPRWGRIAEGAGEDAYLGSKMSAAMVRGYQGTALSKNNTLMACVKHFALYGAAEGGRDYNTVDMSRIKMYEYYLPPYKAAVDAGVGSVMTSFNDVDGVPASANKWLLTDLLRNQWGFKGFIVTDYTSVNEMSDHGLGDLETVSALAMNAGVDMDMVGEGLLSTMKKSLTKRKVSLAQIDQACRRILEAKYKLGLFTDPFLYCDSNRMHQEVLTEANRKEAREFAERSFVLLKNNKQSLPLKKSGTIALVGPLANNKSNMLGTWAISGEASTAITVLDGIRNMIKGDINIIYAKGANITDDSSLAKKANVFGEKVDIDKLSPQELSNEALAAADKSDIVVAVVGEASEMTGEAASRSDIGLPESQLNLLKALSKTGKRLVVVIMSGRPLTLNWEAENATAILQVWFAGHEAGNAIANVLFGNYNPSGKTVITFPRSVGQIPIYYNHKNTGRPQGPGPTQKFRSNYLDISNDPLYPFGYGLSYTSFSYDEIKVNNTNPKGTQNIQASVKVTNTGRYTGEEVVQLYIADPVASISRSVKDLKGFQKIMLKPGESKVVVFNITTEELKFYNTELKRVWEPGEFIIQIGTNSRDVNKVKINWAK